MSAITGIRLLFSLVAVVLLLTGAALPQETHTRTMTFNADELFLVPGLGAGISLEGGKLVVKFVPPPDKRAEQFKDVDLMEGDQIVMLEGTRLKTIEDLRTSYEQAEIDSEIKFGVKRGKDMMICALTRIEAAEGDGPMMIMTKTLGGPDGDGSGMSFQGGGPEDVLALPDVGLILVGRDEGLVVMGALPGVEPTLEGQEPNSGDRILSLAGRKIKTIVDFDDIYQAIKAGEKVKLTYLHEKDTVECTFVKTDMEVKSSVRVKE